MPVVIGDCHGTYKTLLALIEKIKAQYPEEQIVSVGDLVDRGPDSKSVVQYVIDNNILCVRGNHEEMMWKAVLIHTDEDNELWLNNGGFQTLDSYNGDDDLLIKHAKWMKDLPLYIEFPLSFNENGRYLVVSHSNVGEVWKWSKEQRSQEEAHFNEYILWNRYNEEDNIDIYNIFGHTPQYNGADIDSFYTNVDTGAVFTGREGYGKLTAIHWPSMTLIQQENIE